jgi:hypothetical protein
MRRVTVWATRSIVAPASSTRFEAAARPATANCEHEKSGPGPE